MRKLLSALLILVLVLGGVSFASASGDAPTLTILIQEDPLVTDYKDNTFTKMIEADNNVNLEFTFLPSADANTKLNVMISSGEALPDVINHGLNIQDVYNYASAGAFVAIEDKLDELVPNFRKWDEAYPELLIRAKMTAADGHIYSIPKIFFASADSLFQNAWINQEWLDTLGLEMPTTTDELYDVLVAFRDGDPNGNGEQDEIGMVAVNLNDIITTLACWHGFMIDGSTKAFLDGDTMVYAPTTDAFKDTIKVMAKMYADGLVDKDIVTLNQNQIQAKGSGETSVYGTQFCSGSTYWGVDHAPEYTLMPIFTVYEDKDPVWTGRQYANAGSFCITKECKDPALAIRWADLFYSPEYVNWYWMGIEGETYEYNEDGTWQWILQDGETVQDIRNYKCLQSLNLGPSMCPTDWFKIAGDPTESVMNAERIQIVEDAPGACRLAVPVMYYDDEVNNEIKILRTDLNAYYDETIAKFVVGELDIDAYWDTFVKTLNGMGAEDLIGYLQATYDANNAQ